MLSSAGLIQTTQTLNGSLVEEAILTSKISGAKAEAVLSELGLIDAKTGNVIATNECTAAEVAQALATQGIVGADAEAILSQLGLVGANTTATVSFAGLTTAIKANTVAMVKWLATNPVGWCILAVGAIYGLTKAYDALTVSEEEMVEAHEESVEKAKQSISEYEDLQQELDSIQNTYDDNKKKLDELYRLRENQTITQAEEDYLNELEAQNKKLEQQIEYKKSLANVEAQKAEKDAVDALNEKTPDGDVVGYKAGTAQYSQITDAEKIKNNTGTIKALTDDLIAYENAIKGLPLSQDQVDKFSNSLQNLYKLEKEQGYLTEEQQIDKNTYEALLNGTLSYDQYDKAVSTTKENIQGLVSENDQLLQKVEPLNDAIVSTTGKNYELKKSNDEIIANAKDAVIGFNEYTDSLNGTTDALKTSSDAANKTSVSSFEDVWNSADFSDAKDKLLELAKSGEITPKTIESTTEYKKLIDDTGLSAQEVTNNITSMLSVQEKLSAANQGLDKLKSSYEEFKNIGFVTAQALESLPDAFKTLPDFNVFEKIVGNPESGKEKIQQAFNDIVKSYLLEQNTLSGLVNASNSEVQTYIANLKQMGITNAEEIVTQTQQALSNENKLINDAESEYEKAHLDYVNGKAKMDADYLTQTASKNGQLASALGSAYKQDYDNWCELLSQKAEAYNEFVKAVGDSYDESKSITENVNAAMASGQSAAYVNEQASKLVNAQIKANEAKNKVKLDLSQIKVDFSSNYSPSSGSSKGKGGSSGSKTKETKQAIDWIERKITILNNKIDAFATKASDTWSSWTSRTKALNSEMETTKKLLTSVYGISSKTQKKLNSQRDSAKNKLDKYVKKNSKVLTSSTIKKINSGKLDTSKLSKKDKKVIEEYKKLQKDYNKKASKAKKASEKNPAADYYFSKANSVAKKYKLSPAIIKKIKNGTINISDYNESMANAIQKYQDYYDKGKDAQKSKKETKQKLNELAQQNFELIQSKWDARIGYQENRKNAVSDALNLAQSKGQLIGSAYYTKQKGINDKEISQYKKEEAELKKAMKDVPKYSEQWYQYKADLSEVHSKYVQLQADNAELQRSINELKFDRFDELINKIDDVGNECDFLKDLLSDDIFDDAGNITDDGVTAMGLTAMKGNIAASKRDYYKEQLAQLEKDYNNGNGTIGYDDYISRQREYKQGIQDSVKEINDARKATIDYVKQGLDAQNEALSKSIDKQKELLESEKDLKSFQDTILDQNKNIANLRKQIAALEGDSSEETRKRIQQLKSDLQDAEKEQADTLYDRSVSDQEKTLDDMLTKSQDAAENYLKNTDQVFVDALGYVNKNTSQVSQNIEKISKDLGYDISTYITSAWKDGGDAVGTYESTLSSNVTKITAQIQLITNAWQAQCKAAEKAAKASAKAAAGTDETTKDTDKKGNSSNGSGNKSKTSSAKDIKKYITDHADKAKQKKSYYGVLNQYIYDKTGGKVLSVKEEVELAKMLGVSVKSDLSGSGDRKKIYDALLKKKIAFANGGILGDLVKLTGEDGLFIGSAGESILTKEQTQALIDFRPAIPQFGNMMDILKNVSVNSRVQSPTYQIDNRTIVEGVATDKIVKEMEGVAQRQAENVVRKINSATYAKGVRR